MLISSPPALDGVMQGELVFGKRRLILGELDELKRPQSDLGFLTRKQFQVLCLRKRGYSQNEITSVLHMSRSGVSTIEARARKQIDKARQTLGAYDLLQTQHIVIIERGTHLQRIPIIVLHEAD